ncbi:unnamed protein product [Adineta steineri]|uniref:Uncharacterized protein n=1 Tax=Adineta steineri TaxID=433720 RepID=A0A816CH00_9BILA|nr:unnamed protein product [Adineta steineri]CAF1624710.1 unnamed protein product [Adineta steineri]
MNASIITWLTQRWRLLLVILTPLVLLPLPILINNPQGRCGYVVIILSIYWITEAIPLPVTSLLPLILFPMAGVLTAEVVAPHYFKDIIALFFGSMAFGYAVESVNLHRRIALFVLSWVGTGTKWIMAGLMGATAFLSMWINNTASTSIMLPVTLAIVDELSVYNKNSLDRRQRFLLAIAYSSSIGGLSSLVGTTPNIYLKGFIDSKYNGTNFRINFLNFLLFALPVGILMLIFCWLWLQLCYNRKELFQCRPSVETRKSQVKLKALLTKQYRDLGRPKWSELSVGIIFIILIVLWITTHVIQTALKPSVNRSLPSASTPI